MPSSVPDTEELEDLVASICDTYRDLVGAVYTSNSTAKRLPQELLDAVREACNRLENMMGLLEDEIEDPELSVEEIADGVGSIMIEAQVLKDEVRSLVAKIRGLSR